MATVNTPLKGEAFGEETNPLIESMKKQLTEGWMQNWTFNHGYVLGTGHISGTDAWYYDLGDEQRLFVNAGAWEKARERKPQPMTFRAMTSYLAPSILWFFIQLSITFPIKDVNITSLYRPGEPSVDPHAGGVGVDIGMVVFSDKAKQSFMYNRSSLAVREPVMAGEVREWIATLPYVTQYISPWHIWGLKGEAKGCRENRLSTLIETEHKDHLHLSFSSIG